MGDTEEADDGDALAAAAGDELRAGASVVEAFTALAVRTSDFRASALAVCTALGIARSDAEERLSDGAEDLFRDMHQGEEEDCGWILEMTGVFDIHRELDARGEEIRRLLEAAMSATGGMRSGQAMSLSRALLTGELSRAFLSLARSTPRLERGSPAEYWTALVAAGEVMAAQDDADGKLAEVEEALLRCRQKAAQASAE